VTTNLASKIKTRTPHPFLAAFFVLTSLAALLAVVALFQIPADQKNTLLFGLSLQRLLLVGFMAALCACFALAALLAYRSHRSLVKIQAYFDHPARLSALLWISGVAFLFAAIAINTPLYQYGRLQSYIERMQPVLSWFAFSAGLAFFLLLHSRSGLHWSSFTTRLRQDRALLRLGLILGLFFLLIMVFVGITGIGIQPDAHYWYEAGVPLLSLQVFAGLLAALTAAGVMHVSRRWTISARNADLLVFGLIWAVTAILWAAEPLQNSYFAPGPHHPNQNFAPYSDAAVFDIRAQFALIGQGLNNGRYFDRGLYPAFLVLLHLAAGQNYPLMMAVQAALYAVLPAALYLIGTTLINRPAGIFVALLAALRGINAISSASLINSSNQKMMMTDFPTAVLLVLFTLFAVKWLSKPGAGFRFAVLAGGVLGLASLVRTNVLFALPAVLFAALLVYRKSWQPFLLASILIVTAMFISILPWGIRSLQTGAPSILQIYTGRVAMAENTRMDAEAAPPEGTDAGDETPAVAPQSRVEKYLAFAPTAAAHFLHNLVTSVLVLPAETAFHDMANTIGVQTPFWTPGWDGSGISPALSAGIIFNLLFIALGISTAWNKKGIIGLVPLLIFLGYAAANALARTSGGRYIVPMDWVVVFYFAIGVYQLARLGLALFQKPAAVSRAGTISEDELSGERHPKWARQLSSTGVYLAVILALGALIPLSEVPFSQRYEPKNTQEVIASIQSRAIVAEAGITPQQLSAFMQTENAEAITGRLLYPRFFYHNEGIPKSTRPYQREVYPRLGFVVIGPHGSRSVILPYESIPEVKDGMDVMVIGCRTRFATQALLLLTIAEGEQVHLRQPAAPFECPLNAPVCDDNRNCK
jgi:hypothetical protein